MIIINFRTTATQKECQRIIRTINNAIWSLLFQAHMAPTYWVEALHVAVHILNILPSVAIKSQIPYALLFPKAPTYDHLKVFGCLCFPNLNHSNLHKLALRSTPCLFLGYPSNHKGYRCMDLKTNKIIISRHVYFDESVFQKATSAHSNAVTYQFLSADDEPSPLFKDILQGSYQTQIPSISIPQIHPLSRSASSDATQVATSDNRPEPPVRHPMQTRSRTGVSKPKK